MTTISEKLIALDGIKDDIAAAIEAQGVTIGETDTFEDYATRIAEIESGGGVEVEFTSEKTSDIDVAGKYQSTLLTGGDIQTLGTTMPVSPNFSYTLGVDNMPAYTGDSLGAVSHCGMISAGCNNSGAGELTINWLVELVRGGTPYTISSGTSSSIAAGYKYALTPKVFSKNNVVMDASLVSGDIINVYLWCPGSATDIQFDRYGLKVISTRIFPVNNSKKILKDVSLTINAASLTNFNNVNTGNQEMYLNGNEALTLVSSLPTILYIGENPDWGTVSQEIDVGTVVFQRTHSSAYQVNVDYVVTQIKWKESTTEVLP